MPTKPSMSPRPDVSRRDPNEVLLERRRLAVAPSPRDTCPGCLRDLRPFKYQRLEGWCLACRTGRDRILQELMRVPDPDWRKPTRVADAERRAEHLVKLAEETTRKASEAQADLAYLRAEHHVCLECGEAPAAQPSTLCRLCADWREAPAPNVLKSGARPAEK